MATNPANLATPEGSATPALTAWARKYGRFSSTSHKSGLTPTEYEVARMGQKWESVGTIYEEHQKEILSGFTSRELAQLDCLPTRELLPSTLNNFILPMLRVENWETEPTQPDFARDTLYPMANGQGMWMASNPVIWPILKPILVLASKMLLSVYVLPWFDALLNAPRHPVPESRLDPKDQGRDDLFFFQPRPTVLFSTPTASTDDRDNIFALLQYQFKYTFGFMKDGEDPTDPSELYSGACAMTTTNEEYMLYDPATGKIPRIFTWMERSVFEHLLRGDLNSAEKMCIEWAAANTIAHEVMHAIDFIRTDMQGAYGGHEDYFDTEALCELGLSYEHAINLGSTDPFLLKDYLQTPPADIPPLGYFFSRYFPDANHLDSGDPNAAVLKNPGVYMFDEVYPVPITFYEDIQQEAFWSVGVRRFGHGLLHYRSRKQGIRYSMSIDPVTGKVKRSEKTRFEILGNPFPAPHNQFMSAVESLHLAVSLTAEERRAMELGRDLLNSSQSEDLFWDQSAKQAEQVRASAAIVQAACEQPYTIETHRTALLSLLQSTSEAISNHEAQINAIRSLEFVNGTTYPDRRAALKAWNRGTRIYLNVLKGTDEHDAVDIGPLMLDLEVARMTLFNPTDLALQTNEEYDEIESIQQARAEYTDGNLVSCRNTCLGILGTEWCSIFAGCAASAILFALDKDVFEGWDERRRQLDKANNMMRHCKAAAPAAWSPYWAELKMDSATALPRPPDPSARDQPDPNFGRPS